MASVSSSPEESEVRGAEDVTAFSLAGQTVDVRGVLLAALFRGDLEARWRDILLKMACLAQAQEEDLEPDHAALQERADRFRYERDLITTEETEKWLELRRLDSDDFSTHVLRCYWKGVLADQAEPGAEDFLEADEALKGQLTSEVILSGWIDVLCQELQWRMAGRQHARAGEGDVPARIEAERARFFARTGLAPADLGGWLEKIGRDEAWFEEMAAAEAAYAHLSKVIITPEGLTRTLRAQRLSLMRFELEEIEFDTVEAAREAVLCVKEDNLSMEEVAQESRYPYLKRDFVLDELPQEWQIPLLSTPEGSLAGPFEDGDLIRLFRVARKFEPVLEDEAVKKRLEASLLQTFFTEVTAEAGLKAFI